MASTGIRNLNKYHEFFESVTLLPRATVMYQAGSSPLEMAAGIPFGHHRSRQKFTVQETPRETLRDNPRGSPAEFAPVRPAEKRDVWPVMAYLSEALT
jgi:hypothetical protein